MLRFCANSFNKQEAANVIWPIEQTYQLTHIANFALLPSMLSVFTLKSTPVLYNTQKSHSYTVINYNKVKWNLIYVKYHTWNKLEKHIKSKWYFETENWCTAEKLSWPIVALCSGSNRSSVNRSNKLQHNTKICNLLTFTPLLHSFSMWIWASLAAANNVEPDMSNTVLLEK